jgi:hypothetical protein
VLTYFIGETVALSSHDETNGWPVLIVLAAAPRNVSFEDNPDIEFEYMNQSIRLVNLCPAIVFAILSFFSLNTYLNRSVTASN